MNANIILSIVLIAVGILLILRSKYGTNKRKVLNAFLKHISEAAIKTKAVEKNKYAISFEKAKLSPRELWMNNTFGEFNTYDNALEIFSCEDYYLYKSKKIAEKIYKIIESK